MDEGMRPEEARDRFHGDPGDEHEPKTWDEATELVSKEPDNMGIKVIEKTYDSIMWIDENGLHLERCSDWMRRTNRNA